MPRSRAMHSLSLRVSLQCMCLLVGLLGQAGQVGADLPVQEEATAKAKESKEERAMQARLAALKSV